MLSKKHRDTLFFFWKCFAQTSGNDPKYAKKLRLSIFGAPLGRLAPTNQKNLENKRHFSPKISVYFAIWPERCTEIYGLNTFLATFSFSGVPGKKNRKNVSEQKMNTCAFFGTDWWKFHIFGKTNSPCTRLLVSHPPVMLNCSGQHFHQKNCWIIFEVYYYYMKMQYDLTMI